MTDVKTGIEKAREIADKLRQENKEVAVMEEENVAKTLASIAENKNLLSMYKESADLGAENLGGESLPLLKVHSAGKSVKNELANGTEPHNGYFFYKKTQEEFENVYCHVLTISEGFRADGIEGKTNVFNQILGGAIIDDGQLKPFLMYFTGTKLSRLWEFAKEASKYKNAGIPMFALTVKLSTEKVIEGAKQWFVVKFEISKDLDGNPELVTDENEFKILRDNVVTTKKIIQKLISSKSTEETAEIPQQEKYPDAEAEDAIPMDIIKEEMPF